LLYETYMLVQLSLNLGIPILIHLFNKRLHRRQQRLIECWEFFLS